MIEHSLKPSKRHCPRCYFPSRLASGQLVTITDATFHHLFTVLRLKQKSSVKLFNENDGEWLAEVVSITKHQAELDLVSQLRPPSPASRDFILAFAPIKPTNLHFLLEKATELGVTKLVPVITEFTQTRQLNYSKLEAILVAAAEQCERLTIPHLYQAITLPELLKTGAPGHPDCKIIVAHPDGNPIPSSPSSSKLAYGSRMLGAYGTQERSVLGVHEDPSTGATKQAAAEVEFPSPHTWVIGPEGGFSEHEITQFRASPMVQFYKLSENILRAETAAITALTISNMVG